MPVPPGLDEPGEFDRLGVLRLEAVLPPERVRPLREAVLGPLARAGLWADGGWRLDGVPIPQWPHASTTKTRLVDGTYADVAALMEHPAHQAVAEALMIGGPLVGGLIEAPGLRAVVDRLLAGRQFRQRGAQVLLTFPNTDAWTLPTGWHADVARLASGERPGVQLFTFLDVVEPRGGGTLVVAGSHRLLNDGRAVKPGDLQGLLSGSPFIRELYAGDRRAVLEDQARLPAGVVDGIPLQVVELSGAPGEAWLVDLRCLHSVAPNASKRPRLMAADRFVLVGTD